jgi:hypothetical protein
MTHSGLILVLICITLSAGYILLGAFHMVSPQKVLPVYRVMLGKRRFERNARRFDEISPASWKMMGVAYILFGLMLAWAIESIL